MSSTHLEQSIAIIGAGNMGTSLLRGILSAKLTMNKHIVVSGTRFEHLEHIGTKYTVRHTTDNAKAARGADVIILCVKASVIGTVLDEIAPVISEDQLVISIAAGVTIALILKRLGKDVPIIRTMPNIASTVGQGMTALSYGPSVSPKHRETAAAIFSAVGETVVVPEQQLDAVTGLSGSGPAYIYMVIESLIDGGVKMGLPRDIATKLAIQTVLGSATLAKQSNVHPAILRDQVTTPGGTTINAIHELESHGLRSMLIDAVATATIRSRELRELINS